MKTRSKKDVYKFSGKWPDGVPLPGQMNFEFNQDDEGAIRPGPVTIQTGVTVDMSGPIEDGCRVLYRDHDGRDWPGLYRFTLGKLARIVLEELKPGVPVAPHIAVDPGTIRRI